MLPTLLALFYYQRMIKRSHRYATVTGKGYRPRIVKLGKWKAAGLGFVLFYFFIEFVLPLTAVIWTSINPHIRMPSAEAFSTLTLEGYRGAWTLLTTKNILANTVQLTVGVGVAATTISLIIAWIVLRTRMRGRYVLDTIAMLPHAIPSVTFAFAVLIFGLLIGKLVPVFYGSLLAIIVADTILRIPFGTRTLSASLIQIHPELEQAVETCGASKAAAIRRVIIPLIIPALFYTFVWAMLHAYREVTVALFLQTPRNFVMSTAIWDRWANGDSAAAAAMGVLMVGFMSVVILVLLRVFPRVFGSRLDI
jgi:iron(III) transport system permease protein